MEVTMREILDAREHRVQRQKTLLAGREHPLICFTMNIAGPEKNSDRITWGFLLGVRLLKEALTRANIQTLHFEQHLETTGCEAYWVSDARPEILKRITTGIEDGLPVGRLFDMDVLTPEGNKVERSALGLPQRRCLLCENSAVVCGRSRAHSVAELREKTDKLLRQAWEVQTVALYAVQSLLCEVYTTPKPGLVDRRNSGSHRDMDLYTFLRSTAALWRYFTCCVQIGQETAQAPAEETFRQLRQAGLQAEDTMLRATGGVNTHKGAIFTMGLLCGSAGRLPSAQWEDPRAVTRQCADMTRGLTGKELGRADGSTVGKRLYTMYGITGARGQAEAGFPGAVDVGLPVLERGLARGKPWNDAGCAALLAILAQTEDTNLIARGGMEKWRQLSRELCDLLRQEPYPGKEMLEQLDDRFIRENLSPGGSADLLAASYFLYFLKHDLDKYDIWERNNSNEDNDRN